jgi:hypothetical protein
MILQIMSIFRNAYWFKEFRKPLIESGNIFRKLPTPTRSGFCRFLHKVSSGFRKLVMWALASGPWYVCYNLQVYHRDDGIGQFIIQCLSIRLLPRDLHCTVVHPLPRGRRQVGQNLHDVTAWHSGVCRLCGRSSGIQAMVLPKLAS